MVGTAGNMVVDNRNNLDLLMQFQELILQGMEQLQSPNPKGDQNRSRIPDDQNQNPDGRSQNLDDRNRSLDGQSLQNHRMVFLCH